MKLLFVLFFIFSVASIYGKDKSVNLKWLKGARSNDVPKVPLYRRNALSGRIVGGQEITPHSHPYLVALLISTPRGDILCQGSLLNAETVMTSGICLNEATSVIVIAGAHNILATEPNQQRVTVPASGIHIHENFSTNWRAFDIATIWLTSPLTLGVFVQFVTLPYELETDSFAGEQCTVVSKYS